MAIGNLIMYTQVRISIIYLILIYSLNSVGHIWICMIISTNDYPLYFSRLQYIMEDWQNSSLEEKVDLDNLVLFPPDSYPGTERREFGKDIKEEQSEENSDIIENPAYKNIKTEIDELIEPDNDTRSFEFSVNGAEICQICGLEFGNKAVLKIHNSLLHPEEKNDDQNVDLGRKDDVVHEDENTRSDHLKKHIKLVHERIKSFKCNICDYEF